MNGEKLSLATEMVEGVRANVIRLNTPIYLFTKRQDLKGGVGYESQE